MATRISELSKSIDVPNKTLVLFFAEKHPELGITDPNKHHGKSFSWFPEDGHTIEEEIQAELKVFFQEHPELPKTKKDVPAQKEPAHTVAAPKPAPVPPIPPVPPSAMSKAPVAAPTPPPIPATRPNAPVPSMRHLGSPMGTKDSSSIRALFRRYKSQPSGEIFAKLPYQENGDYDKPFRDLANLADKESWDFERSEFRNPKEEFPILKNYLNYTFLRALDQNRVVYFKGGTRACFNTGLQTFRGKDIYASFFRQPNKYGMPDWTLWGFTDDPLKLNLNSRKLPLPPSYYEGGEAINLVFDLSYTIDINYDHILVDNKERFPERFRNDAILERALKGAITELKEKIRRNYKIAIPHWYKEKLQLLLPLSLSGGEADLALVAERNDLCKTYKIITALTVDQAYLDARLICRPSREWLKP